MGCAGIICNPNPSVLKYISTFEPNAHTQAHTRDRDLVKPHPSTSKTEDLHVLVVFGCDPFREHQSCLPLRGVSGQGRAGAVQGGMC